MQGRFVTSAAQAAVLAALTVYTGQCGQVSPWMDAAALADFVGAPGADDPQFEAVIRSLYSAGAIRLMVEDTTAGPTRFRAMLVRPV